MQMHQRGKRPRSLGLRQKAGDDTHGRRQKRLVAFEREAALQRPNLIPRAFELHAVSGMRGAANCKRAHQYESGWSQWSHHDGLRRDV